MWDTLAECTASTIAISFSHGNKRSLGQILPSPAPPPPPPPLPCTHVPHRVCSGDNLIIFARRFLLDQVTVKSQEFYSVATSHAWLINSETVLCNPVSDAFRVAKADQAHVVPTDRREDKYVGQQGSQQPVHVPEPSDIHSLHQRSR